jgi:hypothetical protein
VLVDLALWRCREITRVCSAKVTHGPDYGVEQRRPSQHLLRLGLAVEGVAITRRLDKSLVRALNQDRGTLAFLLLASRTVQGLHKRPWLGRCPKLRHPVRLL